MIIAWLLYETYGLEASQVMHFIVGEREFSANDLNGSKDFLQPLPHGTLLFLLIFLDTNFFIGAVLPHLVYEEFVVETSIFWKQKIPI